jgi:hypothetical protein
MTDATQVAPKHLRYRLGPGSPPEHPQKVMKELGITYALSQPHSFGDQWWFWGCEGVPEILPSYLSALNLDPQEQIGRFLSKEQADIIAAGLSPKESTGG